MIYISSVESFFTMISLNIFCLIPSLVVLLLYVFTFATDIDILTTRPDMSENIILTSGDIAQSSNYTFILKEKIY